MKQDIRTYITRATLVLIGLLLILAAVVWWIKQYSAVQEQMISGQVSSQQQMVNAAIVKNLPLDSLATAQVYRLKQFNKGAYLEQLAARAHPYPTPALPMMVTVQDTGFGQQAFIEWFGETNDYDGIIIYRSNEVNVPGTELTKVKQVNGNYHDNTVTNNQVYYYTAQTYRQLADGSVKTSALSETYMVTITDSIAPIAPALTAVKVSAANPTAIEITWQATPENDVVQYNIYRSEQPGLAGEVITTTTATSTTWLDSTEQAGITYYYSVTATDEAGNESAKNYALAPYGNAQPFITNL
ncbi:MAG: hypothetical protein WCW27_03565 [Patescibacteria group bacterium]|jgi:hypothetical protein